MKTKNQKLALVDELIKELGLTQKEVIAYWDKQETVSLFNLQKKSEISRIKAGMFWYEDNTFSFKRLANKKIKAIVELVEDGVIYGDLTASELFYVEEKVCKQSQAMEYIDDFSYLCKEGEKVICYDRRLFELVYKQYSFVKKSFERINQPYRITSYWTNEKASSEYGYIIDFTRASQSIVSQHEEYAVRPVLALKVDK